MPEESKPPTRALKWEGGLHLLDQTRLPGSTEWLHIQSVEQLISAIQRLSVRGAPAIGCAAAYGMVLATQDCSNGEEWKTQLLGQGKALREARPTAVNLVVGVDLMVNHGLTLLDKETFDPNAFQTSMLEKAKSFHKADEESCAAIGRHGATLLKEGACILTHYNAGPLATGGDGTALSIALEAHRQGNPIRVLADETRPLLQGARITCWEMDQAGIPVTLQCDGAAPSALASGLVDAVIVGADRIAANGDVVNKIGTLGLALCAHEYNVPFIVAAPTSTIDLQSPTGDSIPIEERAAEEVRGWLGVETTVQGVTTRNPAFDCSPAKWVTALVTEKGIIHAPSTERIAAQLS